MAKEPRHRSLWSRYQQLTLWNKLGVWTGLASILGLGLTLIAFFWKPQTSSLPQLINRSVSANGNITVIRGVIQTDSGTIIINNIEGIDPEEYRAIAEELGVKDSALDNFFKILQRKKVPPEYLDSTLRQIAKHYQELRARVRMISPADPKVALLRDTADAALEKGEFEQAEALLNQATALDLKAVKGMQKMTKQRLLSAANSRAANGDLKNTQLAYVEAAEYYQQAAELVPADEQSILAEYLNKEGNAWFEAGQYAKAQTPLEGALDIREKTLGPEHLDVAASFSDLAVLHHTQGRHKVAEQLYQQALDIWEKAPGPTHSSSLTTLNNLASLYRDQDRYKQAESLFQKTLKIREKVLGPAHPDLATSLNNLATLYYARGQYKQAESLFQKALKIREKVLGPVHPDLATSLNNLAVLYDDQGHYKQAESLHQRALDIREKTLGPAHPDVAISLNNLAKLYYAQGQYEQAEPLYQRALAIRKKVLGSKHSDVAASLNSLALLYYRQGRYGQAEPLYQRALAIREKVLRPKHPDVAVSLNNLAKLYYKQGRYEAAKPLYQRALSIVEKALGPEHPNSVRVRENYAALLGKMKQADMALSTPE